MADNQPNNSQQQRLRTQSASSSVPDNIGAGAALQDRDPLTPTPVLPSVTVAGGTARRQSRSTADLAHQTAVGQSPLRASLTTATARTASAEVNRLAGVEARVAWMFPPEIFAAKRRGDEGSDEVDDEDSGVGCAGKRKVRKYYKRQDELIDMYCKLYQDSAQNEQNGAQAEVQSPDDTDSMRSVRLAQLSFMVNLSLLILKAVAIALSNGSLSVISSLIDSMIDLVSGVVVWVANRQVKSRNPYYYPQGKTRLEPIAIVILAVIMSTATVQIIVRAVENVVSMATEDKALAANGSSCACPGGYVNGTLVVSPSSDGKQDSWISVFGLVGSVITLKLILFILCYKFGTTSSTEALAQDHRNDVVSNTTVLIMIVLSYYIWPYFDPMGALGISAYIIYTWVQTLKEQVRMLTGYTADPDCLKQIIFISANHHPLIQHLESVRAFHIGNNHLVEVDIVVPGELNLREAHDIGESLQRKIEKLDWVERAFVHLDHEFEHHPMTEHKQV